jgi:hypothetical protein
LPPDSLTGLTNWQPHVTTPRRSVRPQTRSGCGCACPCVWSQR